MYLRQFLFLILFTGYAAASSAQQGSVSGKITDAKTGLPLAAVSVFLSNATVGDKTNESGTYRLTGIKQGTYDLVVSIMGYQQFSKQVQVNGNAQQLDVAMEPKAIQMAEIVLKQDPNWLNNYRDFKRRFLGPSAFAEQCNILNPKAVWVEFDKRILSASSEDFIEIENKALGYKLKFLLNTFQMNYTDGSQFYAGQVLFEQMKGSKRDQNNWKKNREYAYYGSGMHFFRSLKNGTTTEDGFKLHRLVRLANPLRPSDSVITANIRRLRAEGETKADSIVYWRKLAELPAMQQYLIEAPLRPDSLASPTPGASGNMELSFSDFLAVDYPRKKSATPFVVRQRFGNFISYDVSSVLGKKFPIVFDSNGILIDPRSVIYEGSWGEGVSTMLPYDYEPEKK